MRISIMDSSTDSNSPKINQVPKKVISPYLQVNKTFFVGVYR